MVKRDYKLSGDSSYEGTNPMTSSKPNYTPGPHLQTLSHWELGLQNMSLGETQVPRRLLFQKPNIWFHQLDGKVFNRTSTFWSPRFHILRHFVITTTTLSLLSYIHYFNKIFLFPSVPPDYLSNWMLCTITVWHKFWPFLSFFKQYFSLASIISSTHLLTPHVVLTSSYSTLFNIGRVFL